MQTTTIPTTTTYTLPTQARNDNNPEPGPMIERILIEYDDQRQAGGKEVAKPECNNIIEPRITVLKPYPRPEPETCDPEKKDGPLQSWQKSQCLGWAELEPAFSPNLFLEWEVGAPLEVIYEAFEGEEEGGEAPNDAFWGINEGCKKAGIMIERYPSFSRYNPEPDSDMDSDCASTTSFDEEEEREGLIEIALDCDYGHGD